jgi:hypothetical protein
MQSFASGGGVQPLVPIEDAPTDGEVYGRQNAAWVEVPEEAPSNGQIHGRINETWQALSSSVAAGIAFTPAGDISATNVQAALVELDTEKANIASPTFTGDPKAPTPGTADNDTSIATTAHVQANMALKANVTHTHAQGDVTNLVTDLGLKAPLASPTFTGDPKSVTPATADNDTSIATTAHVQANMALKASLTHTHVQSDVTNLVTDLGLKAPLASPTFTGTPAAPTATLGTNTTQLATTAFVATAISGAASATHIGDTPPGSPTAGQLFWESDSGNLFIYYVDGSSSQWVPATVGTQGPPGPAGTSIAVGTTAPASPATNDLWMDTN